MLKENKLIIAATRAAELLYLPMAVISGKSVKLSKLMMNAVVSEFSKKSSHFYYKYCRFEKNTCVSTKNELIRNVGIVIQGPIRYKDNFTLNTALRYKQLYPNVEVVISTWDTEQTSFFEECDKYGIKYIKNKLLDSRINFNYQIFNSKAGVDFLKEKNVDYILKTRTDQRLYSECFLENLLSLVRIHPVQGDDYDINERLVFMNADASSYKCYAYHLSDMVVFGNANDMSKLYNIPLKAEGKSAYEISEDKVVEIVNKIRLLEHDYTISLDEVYEKIENYDEFIDYRVEVVAELYIVYEFIKNVRKDKRKKHLQEYWNFLKKAVILVDKEVLELYWPKYINEYWQANDSQKFGYLSYCNWLEFAYGNKEIDENK